MHTYISRLQVVGINHLDSQGHISPNKIFFFGVYRFPPKLKQVCKVFQPFVLSFFSSRQVMRRKGKDAVRCSQLR